MRILMVMAEHQLAPLKERCCLDFGRLTIHPEVMVRAPLTALAFNYAGKRTLAEGQELDGSVSRRNLEINIAFYVTAGVTILFLHNWFSLLAQGAESLAGNHQAWVIWAAVDTMLPLVLGTTGYRIMREKS